MSTNQLVSCDKASPISDVTCKTCYSLATHPKEDPEMSEIFRKLNVGNRAVIHVLNAPASFEPELKRLRDVEVKSSLRGKTGFALGFAVTRKDLDNLSRKLVGSAEGDAVIWVAYPKGSSKRYACEFNRDRGWTVLGDAGYEPVRMVSIDEDWSALRFRKAEKIGRLTRGRAISKAGQGRLAKPGKKEVAANKAKPEKRQTVFASHEDYFAIQTPEARSLLEWVQQMTEKVVPEATRCISYGMPAFRLKKLFLCFAAFKQHLGIYPPLRKDARLVQELQPYRGPKGNLSFPYSQPFPKALVKRVLVALALEHGGKTV